MIRMLIPTFLLLFTYVPQRCQSAESFSLNSNPELLFEFYGNAYSLLPFSEFLRMYNSETKIDSLKTELRLSTISVENYIAKILLNLMDLLEDYNVNEKIQKLMSSIKQVENLYEEYTEFRHDFNRTQKDNITITPSNNIYEDYIYQVFRSNMYGIAETLDEIEYFITQESVIDTIVTKIKEPKYSCEQKLSHMQMIEGLLRQFVILETKGFLILSLGYDIKERLYKDDFSLDRRIVEQKCNARYKKISKKFKKLMVLASDQVYVCDAKKYRNGKTYVEFKNMFQQYLLQEYGGIYCNTDCKMFNDFQTGPCVHHQNAPRSLCESTYRCSAALQDCKPLKSDYYDVYPKICISNNSYTTRRYDYVLYDENDKRQCNEPYRGGCVYCACTCPYGKPGDESEYGFNLDINLANIDENYVVTGAKLVNHRNVIQIQLQQGKLLPHGGIDPDTIKWVRIKKYEKALKNAYKLNWTNRSVNLHNLKVPENNVVVGLKFIEQLTLGKSHLALELYSVPFNFTNGTLAKYAKVKSTIFTYNSSSLPTELSLLEKDIPINTKDNILDSEHNQYLRFQTSGLQQDGGQSTIPFIDKQEIVPAIPTPLSGIGLIHRGTSTSGGFLGLNLFTYNVAPHIEIEKENTAMNSIAQIYAMMGITH